MKILKAIGNFFVKIWRWIKNTAWVQPLLIVGAIFGVIFSIPAITSGIQGLINSSKSADKFYENYKKSLEGGATSEAEVLLDHYEYKVTHQDTYNLPKDEEKYFVMFTAKNNSTASDIKGGFQTLKDKWNDNFKPEDSSHGFKLYTIYTDEVTKQTTKTKTAFDQFLGRKNWFFESASIVGRNSVYKTNGGITDADLDKIETPDPSTFITPTIIFVDWTGGSTTKGIAQVMFSVPGEDDYAKASLLADCWNCRRKFKETTSN